MMLGLRQVSTLVCVALVATTSAFVGAIMGQSAQVLLDEARDVELTNRHLLQTSCDANIRDMTREGMLGTMREITGNIMSLLRSPADVLENLKHFVELHHPDNVTDPVWIDEVLSPRMAQSILSSTVTRMFFEALPFSPSHPNATDRGGASMFWYMPNGVWLDPSKPPLIWARELTPDLSRSGKGGALTNVVEVNGFCEPQHADKPCVRDPDYTEGRPFGRCMFPREVVMTDAVFEPLRDLFIRNSRLDNGSMAPANDVMMLPLFPYYQHIMQYAGIPLISPQFQNLGGRHDGRFAFITVVTSTEEVFDLLRTQSLPAGGVLYGVEAATGNLIGSNHYHIARYYEAPAFPGADYNETFIQQIVPMNHTKGLNSTEPSVIAYHSRSLHESVAFPVGFEVAAKNTAEDYLSWREPTAQQPYLTMTHVLSDYSLRWYINLLVPREAVMGDIDRSAAEVTRLAEAAIADGENKQRASVMVTVGATVGVAVVLMLLGMYAASRVVQPVLRLQQDMSEVAHMNVSNVTMGKPSSISEIHSMQMSFMLMVKSLEEYKHYMPQSLLVEDESEREENMTDRGTPKQVGEANTTRSSSFGSTSRTPELDSKGRIGSNLSLQSGSRQPKPLVKNENASMSRIGTYAETREVLKTRKITVAWFNLVGFHAATQEDAGRNCANVINTAIQLLAVVCRNERGVPDVFAGDHLLMTWNAFALCSEHQLHALKAASQCAEDMSKCEGPRLSVGVGSGEASVGHLGCQGMKRVTILSPVVPFVSSLETLNKREGHAGLCDQFVMQGGEQGFLFKATEIVTMRKRIRKRVSVFTFEPRTTLAQTQEWMYEIEQLQTEDKHAGWNGLFKLLSAAEWSKAEAQLEELRERLSRDDVAKAVKILDQKEFQPVDFDASW